MFNKFLKKITKPVFIFVGVLLLWNFTSEFLRNYQDTNILNTEREEAPKQNDLNQFVSNKQREEDPKRTNLVSEIKCLFANQSILNKEWVDLNQKIFFKRNTAIYFHEKRL